jgi:hypothetical protein
LRGWAPWEMMFATNHLGLFSASRDTEIQRRLWDASAELVGL